MTDLPSSGYFAYPPPAPPDPTGGDPTAVMGRRILAWLIDLALFVAVVGGVFAALAERVEVPESFALDPCEQLQEQAPARATGCVDFGDDVFITSDSDAALQTLASVGYLVFFIVLQGVTGASPGKLLTGVRVVNDRGRVAGVGRSTVRTLLWAVDGAPWIVPLVGFITGVTSSGHRRVGDLAASTYVVATDAVGTPPASSTPSFDPTAPRSWAPPAPPSSDAGTTDLPPPHWDQARGTYIQWDPGQRAWLQWDTVVQRWKPIDS